MHIRTYYIDARYLTWTTTYVRRSRIMVHMKGGGRGSLNGFARVNARLSVCSRLVSSSRGHTKAYFGPYVRSGPPNGFAPEPV